MFSLQMILFTLLLSFVLHVFAIVETNRSTNHNVSHDMMLQGKLVFAHVIYRHGDRTIINPYPNNPWKDPKYWPDGFGAITNLGKEQHYQLGRWLRKRYNSILSRKYIAEEIYVQSTDMDRTLMSALANLAGLYPPVDEQIWNKDIAWQPIPVHTTPRILDHVLAAKAPCPEYEREFATVQNSAEFQEMRKRFSHLLEYLTEHTGRKIDTFLAAQYINNSFFIEHNYNYSLPEWAQKIYPSPALSYLSNFEYSIRTYTPKLARLKAGPIIKEMLERFKLKSTHELHPNRSVWVYSGHDTTLSDILNTLKMFELHTPPFTACLMLELRLNDANNPFVSIFYKNTSAEPYPMHIPGCGIACPLEKMFELYADILPLDWHSECRKTPSLNGLIVPAVVVIFVVMLIGCIALVVVIKSRRAKPPVN